MDISGTIAPKSDQLDAVDLVSGARTFTIESVSKGSADQPVNLHLSEFPRPWRPGLSMRRVLVSVWGADASAYVGRRVRLFCDPDVEYGGQAVGGIRVEALSHIDGPKRVPLLIKRGRSAMFTVQPLPDQPDYLADAQAAQSLDEWRAVWQRAKDAGHLDNALKAQLTPIGEALKAKPQRTAHILPVDPPNFDDMPDHDRPLGTPETSPPAAAEDNAQPVGDAGDEQAAIEWPDVQKPVDR